MLDRQHGKIVVECDACGETLETDTKDFSEALRIMRAADWQARKLGQDWIHTCFGCAEKSEREERARRSGRIP